MSQSNQAFRQFENNLNAEGDIAAFEFLADHYRDTGKYPELFEVLKAKIRLTLGLPLLSTDNLDQLDESVQIKLEDQLLEACGETGFALLNDGQIAQAWNYLQPLPDRKRVTHAFEAIEVNDENSAEFLEIALYAGAAPVVGYRLLLQQQGTCNGITFYDTQAAYLSEANQQKLAAVLVTHIYDELCDRLASDITEKENAAPVQSSLADLIDQRAWLFEDCGHHLDVTHLASVVRIARRCESTQLHKALELSMYGMKLDSQLHYPSEAPFSDCYLDHYWYFCGRTGLKHDQAVEHFRSKLKATPDEKTVTLPIVIELLHHGGQSSAAIQEMLNPNENEWTPQISELIGLAKTEADFNAIAAHYIQQNDLLGYSMALAAKHQAFRKA